MRVYVHISIKFFEPVTEISFVHWQISQIF